MQVHQERVVQEKAELDEKLERLLAFLKGSIVKSLNGDEQYRLSKQAALMKEYSDVLAERIAAFQ